MIAKDDYIIVLDFLPNGKPTDRKAEPVAQGIGEKFLNLLEIAVKDGVVLKANDRVYVGDDKRDQVKYIRGRIGYQDLTNYAKNMVVETVTVLVDKDEKRFVNFFNKAGPVTTRLHSLELLPGIGKKHMWDIIGERRRKPFEDFKELQNRVPMLPDPKKMVIKRVIEDLEGKDRYCLFVGSPVIR
jgi:putative nucleotide binding protein